MCPDRIMCPPALKNQCRGDTCMGKIIIPQVNQYRSRWALSRTQVRKWLQTMPSMLLLLKGTVSRDGFGFWHAWSV
jgi:hypothetical protein